MPIQKYQRVTTNNQRRAPLTPRDRHELFAVHHPVLSDKIGSAVRGGASSDEIMLTLSMSGMPAELLNFMRQAIRHEIEWWQIHNPAQPAAQPVQPAVTA